MTTDETRDQSGNAITEAHVARALRDSGREDLLRTDAPETITAALRAAGLLVEGAPTDEQVEAAIWALIESDTDTSDRGVSDEHYRERRADVERIAPILCASVAPAPEHIADEAVQKLRALGLDDTAIRERLTQATMLAAALASDGLVRVIAKIAAKAMLTSEDLHQIERAGIRLMLQRIPAPVDEAKLAEAWDEGFHVGDGVGAYSKRERDEVNPYR